MKIMLATDGSEYATLAEALMSRLPMPPDAEVEVVSVSAMLPILGVGVPPFAEPSVPAQAPGLWEELHKHAERAASDAAGRLAARGIKSTEVVLDGDVAGELLEHAEKTKADLIFLGGRGENWLAQLLLGSVARKLVSHATCSTMVAHSYRDKSPEESMKILAEKKSLTALIAVDGSDGSQAAVEGFKKFASSFDRVLCLSVNQLPVLPPAIIPMVTSLEVGRTMDESAEIAGRAVGQLEGVVDKVEPMHVQGNAGHEIVKAAEEMGADLIVLGATQHGLIERFLIGSVAYDVTAHAPCSVFVVRP